MSTAWPLIIMIPFWLLILAGMLGVTVLIWKLLYLIEPLKRLIESRLPPTLPTFSANREPMEVEENSHSDKNALLASGEQKPLQTDSLPMPPEQESSEKPVTNTEDSEYKIFEYILWGVVVITTTLFIIMLGELLL